MKNLGKEFVWRSRDAFEVTTYQLSSCIKRQLADSFDIRQFLHPIKMAFFESL